jgi:hypothetical protein
MHSVAPGYDRTEPSMRGHGLPRSGVCAIPGTIAGDMARYLSLARSGEATSAAQTAGSATREPAECSWRSVVFSTLPLGLRGSAPTTEYSRGCL